MNLFDYQVTILDEIRQAYRKGKNRPLLVAPTGSGKTCMFSAICKGAAAKGSRVMILVHRQELIDQVSATLREFSVPHGIISPDYFISRDAVQVASVFTLIRRFKKVRYPDLIIIDEAHHAIPQSSWGTAIKAFPKARLLGVTATPVRLSGQGLGDTFDTLIMGPTVQALIDAGRLAPVDIYAPPSIDVSKFKTRMGEFVHADVQAAADRPSVTGDAIEHYYRHAQGKRAAVFCVSVEHATHIAAQANGAGISAVMIDSKMDRELRRQVIKDFGHGKIKWLVSVDLISEGFDCPGIEVGISLRPTASLGLWLQQCGRILRTSPGKDRALILDHAGNTLRHGLPTESRHWTLSGCGPKKAGDGPKNDSVRVCPKCFSAGRSGGRTCGNCGFTFEIESRTIARKKGTLEKITPEQAEKIRERQAVDQAKSLQAIIDLGTRRGYKDPAGWASHVMAGRYKKRTVKA
jgi:DNA repair protein RadD